MYSHIGDAVVNMAYLLNPQAVFLPHWNVAGQAVHRGCRQNENGQLRTQQLVAENGDFEFEVSAVQTQ